MSIRPPIDSDDEYPTLPEVEPMTEAAYPTLLAEFLARHCDDPDPHYFKNGDGVWFYLGDPETSPKFAFLITERSVTFHSCVDFVPTEEATRLLTELFQRVAEGVAYGALSVTNEGMQWEWKAPALHYPYLFGVASHAIAYAGYLQDKVWEIARQVVDGEISVDRAVAVLQRTDDELPMSPA